MLDRELAELRSVAETLRIRSNRLGGPVSASERAAGVRAARAFRFALEAGDPELSRAAERMLVQLDDAPPLDLLETPTGAVGSNRIAETIRRLEAAFELGKLVATPESTLPFRSVDEAPEIELPPLPPRKAESKTTFFEVRVVDEIGQAINGLSVELDVDSTVHDVTTNAAGVALLEGVVSSSGSVTAADGEALDRLLEPRWKAPRRGSPPKEANLSEFLFEGGAIGPVGIKSVVSNTIVVKPPRGRLFLELYDKTGRVRHADSAYTIEGPESFSGKTDETGQLLHEDVFPGDYRLELQREFFEGKDKVTDTYECPLVVLAREDTGPEVRMLGSVPFAVLARLHLFFNTNKTFLLPTALPGIFELQDTFLQNNPCELLVVGHADTAGGAAFNDTLSLERAKSIIAFLKDDVDTWLDNYADGIPKAKRWGRPEDRMMLVGMADFRTKPKGEDAVKWFQRTRKLEADGKCGPITRRQLVTEYMALDGVSLAEQGVEINATAHGCGEHFPVDDGGKELDENPADEKRDGADRRVELFFFDPEFGLVPKPPGQNSQEGSTEYPEWRKRVIEIVDIEPGVAAAPAAIFLEVADAHFDTNSAVVLPQVPGTEEDPKAITSPRIFAAVLLFNEDNPGKRVFVAGHADTTASIEFNQKLSKERADCALALLLGGNEQREQWKSLCDERHTVSDYKAWLKFIARAFKDMTFDCDPGAVDDVEGTGVEPVKRFQRSYNTNKTALGASAPDLEPDGDVGPLTWGAIFDCHELLLARALGVDLAGLAEIRGRVSFADPERRALGFSEHFPLEELGVDDFRSQLNRRVEILFFDSAEEPDLDAAEEDPETAELYLPGFYVRTPLDVGFALGETVNFTLEWPADVVADLPDEIVLRLSGPGVAAAARPLSGAATSDGLASIDFGEFDRAQVLTLEASRPDKTVKLFDNQVVGDFENPIVWLAHIEELSLPPDLDEDLVAFDDTPDDDGGPNPILDDGGDTVVV